MARKKIVYSTYLEPEQFERLRAHARATGRSQAAVLRDALDSYLPPPAPVPAADAVDEPAPPTAD